jgi:hypothetical protein
MTWFSRDFTNACMFDFLKFHIQADTKLLLVDFLGGSMIDIHVFIYFSQLWPPSSPRQASQQVPMWLQLHNQ